MNSLPQKVSDDELKHGDRQKVKISPSHERPIANPAEINDASWKELLKANEVQLDQWPQNLSSKIDPDFVINEDASDIFSKPNYFRKSDEVSRERTARSVGSYYHTLVAGLNTPVVRENDQLLRVTIRNLGNNYCMIGSNQNVTLQNMTDIIFGAAGTVPVPGESVQIEGSTEIYVNSPTGTTILVKIEYARI